MKLILLAVPGAGKTTIVNTVRKAKPSIAFVNFGDVMFEIARKRFGIEHRDEMRKRLGIEDYRKLQLAAGEEIGKMKGDMIIDTHATIKTPKGYYPGLPNEIVGRINPDVIFNLEFDPKFILERRAKDSTRQTRDSETEDDIRTQQELNKIFACDACAATRATILHYRLFWKQRKPFEHSEAAAKEIVRVFGEK